VWSAPANARTAAPSSKVMIVQKEYLRASRPDAIDEQPMASHPMHGGRLGRTVPAISADSAPCRLALRWREQRLDGLTVRGVRWGNG
jgi:hypothetical protein